MKGDPTNPVKGLGMFTLCLGVCPFITYTVFCGLYMSMWIQSMDVQSFYETVGAAEIDTKNAVGNALNPNWVNLSYEVPDTPYYD